jgi:hypothetical protein
MILAIAENNVFVSGAQRKTEVFPGRIAPERLLLISES